MQHRHVGEAKPAEAGDRDGCSAQNYQRSPELALNLAQDQISRSEKELHFKLGQGQLVLCGGGPYVMKSQRGRGSPIEMRP